MTGTFKGARKELYREQNEWAASVILDNLERYGGPDSLPVIWAVLVLCEYDRTRADWGAAT